MKKSFLIILVFSVSIGNAQTAKDFFFPANGKNSSIFKSPIPGHKKKFQHNETLFFKDMGDSALVTTVYYDENTSPGGHEQLLKITDTEILVVRGKANTHHGKLEAYTSQGMPIFKMPKENDQTEWSSPNQKGAAITIYRSEFETIKIDGKKMKAVKVSRIEKRKHSGEESVFYVDHYVAGIGLYKRTSESGLELDVLAEQKFDPNFPVLN